MNNKLKRIKGQQLKMKKAIKNLIILFSLYVISSKAQLNKEINFEPDNSLIRLRYISDSPNLFNDIEKNSYLIFFRLLNKYENVIIYSFDYNKQKIDYSRDYMSNIKMEICLKGDDCNINIKQQINNDKYKQELRAKIWRSEGYLEEVGETFAIIFFNSNKTLNTLSDKNNYIFKFYFDKNLINNIRMLLTRYDSQEIEKELIKYNKIIEEPSICEKELIIYCNILKNRKNKIEILLNNNKVSNLKKRLMFDTAIINKKDSISSMFLRQKIESLHFVTKKSLLYAASFYNLKEILEIIAVPEMIDSLFPNGLTALGVAIAADSNESVKLLIEKGAVSAGDYYMSFWLKESVLSRSDNYEILDFFIFKYKDKTRKPKIISDILIRNAYEEGDKCLIWLKQFQKSQPKFFNEIILKNSLFSKELLLASSYLSKSIFYDFLVELGIDKCLIQKTRVVKKNRRSKRAIPVWYVNKYEKNKNECK